MKVLMVGDLVGEEASEWLASRVPALRDEHDLDFVVVNAENAAVTGPNPMNGFGITTAIVEMLIDAGVDAFTGGNHSWDGPEVNEVFADPRVIRPANIDDERGQGSLALIGHDGMELTVVNMLSPTAELPDMNAPKPEPLWPAWQRIAAEHNLPGAVVIDLHGESPWEKASMASALDGTITAIVGTHTHDPALRGHVLPGGTGFVSELGMTGRLGFTGGGFDPVHFATRFRGEPTDNLPPYSLATGEMAMGAVVLEISPTYTTTAITRIQ